MNKILLILIVSVITLSCFFSAFPASGLLLPEYNFGGAVPGDANGDKTVNVADALLVLKHIAKWDVELNTHAVDVDDDGIVNVADVTLMLKYIAKWDITLK